MASDSRFVPKGITTLEENEASYLSEYEVGIEQQSKSRKVVTYVCISLMFMFV